MIHSTWSRVAVAAALLTATFLLLSVTAQAQSRQLNITIPFSFYTGQTLLQPGDYELMNIGNGVVMLVDRNTRKRVAFPTIHVNSTQGRPVSAKIVFNKYGEDHFLSEVWWAGQYGNRSIPSKAERELARSSTPVRIAIAE